MDENLYNVSNDFSDFDYNDSGHLFSSSDVSSENESTMDNTGYNSIDYSDYFERLHEDLLSVQECLISEDTEVTPDVLHSDLRCILLVLVAFLALTVFRGFHSLIKGL